jgi:hypothetical protein
MQAVMSRRFVAIAGALTVASMAHAQQATPQFVGRWTGHVPGLGNAEIVVTAVRANGQVDGQMVFPDQNQTFTFGEKLDITKNINHGVVQGPSLTIETAMGGTYRLNLQSGSLRGEYVRGNTYKVPVTFQKAT